MCRRVNSPPEQNISSKEWAEQLQKKKTHQLLAITNSYEKGNNTESEVFCDSCTQNGEQVIATFRCKQCRDNLCETCCKLIHKRVKAFAFHTIVDLRSDMTEINTTTDVGNCLVHSNRSIEVYCFDHGELGCSFCLTTKHNDCKTVLSWDEVAENDLENLSKSFKREKKTNQRSQHIGYSRHKEKYNRTQKKNEILQNIGLKIKAIKKRLDSLHVGLERSLKHDHEGQISNLTSVLQTLNDFDATLAQSESIASTTMQIGSRKQIFIAMEKMKMQISDHLRSMGTKRKQLKASTISCIWSFNGPIDSLNKLTTLGDFKYTVKEFDFVAQFEKH